MMTEIPLWLGPAEGQLPAQSAFGKIDNVLTQPFCVPNVFLGTDEGPMKLGSVIPVIKDQVALATNRLLPDLFGHTTTPEDRQHADHLKHQIKDFAPQIIRAIMDGSAVKEIGETDPTTIAETAIAIARQPELAGHLVIQTGFGGSEAAPTASGLPLRLPAYALPAVKIWENLDGVLTQMGVDARPTINLFWAGQAAININGMDPEAVLATARHSQAYIQAYLEQHHPEAAQHVRYTVDQPWEQHTPTTDTLVNYLTILMMNSLGQGGAVLDTAQAELANRAQVHGAEDHHQYTALHPVFFEDPLPAPAHHDYFGEPINGNGFLFNLTIGGPPERAFNAARVVLSAGATPQGLQAYAETTGQQVDRNLLTDSVFPLTSRLIGPVGDVPVYYPQPGELTTAVASPQTIREWQADIRSTIGVGQAPTLEQIGLRAAASDLGFLLKDCGSPEALMNIVGLV
jgi:hypothetical protein